MVVCIFALALIAWGLFFNRQNSMDKNLNLPYFNANNNPLNLRPSSRGGDWQGQIGVSSKNFSIFENSCWGFRAAHKNMETYLSQGINTIRDIVTTWAPPSDNNPTSVYVNNVAFWTGIHPDRVIWRSDIPNLLAAMTRQETGKIVTEKQVKNAIKSVGYAI